MKNKQYDKEQPRRRFNKKVDGPTVMEWYAKMPTVSHGARHGVIYK